MPAKLKYGFLCDGAMFVQGKWTYQGLFDVINAADFPMVHPQAVLAFKFSGPVGPRLLRIQFVDSMERPLMPELRNPIECREFADTVVSINLQSLTLSGPGFYSFKLYLDQELQPFGVVEFQAVRYTPPKPSRT